MARVAANAKERSAPSLIRPLPLVVRQVRPAAAGPLPGPYKVELKRFSADVMILASDPILNPDDVWRVATVHGPDVDGVSTMATAQQLAAAPALAKFYRLVDPAIRSLLLDKLRTIDPDAVAAIEAMEGGAR